MSIAIDLINPEDTIVSAKNAFPQSGKNPIVSAWIETTVNNWLRKEPSCATVVPPGSKDVPAWAVKKLTSGRPVHRFLVGAWARDHLSHIEDFLAEVVKASKNENNPLHKTATDVLRGLPRTGVEQAYQAANDWFKSISRLDDDDTAVLKKFKGRKEIETSDGLMWQMALPSDLRRIASQLENCLGRRHYAADVRKGKAEIWSLQNKEGRILVAAHIDVEAKAVKEAKSKNNTLPITWKGHVKELAAARNVSTNGQDALHLDHQEQEIENLRRMQVMSEVGKWRVVANRENGSVKAWHEEGGHVLDVASSWTVGVQSNSAEGNEKAKAISFDLTLASMSHVPEVQDLETAIGSVAADLPKYLSDGMTTKVINKKNMNFMENAGDSDADLGLLWESSKVVSWRNTVADTARFGDVAVHTLGSGAIVVEYGDRIHLLAESRTPIMTVTERRMQADLSSWPEIEDILRTIDPGAARSVAVSENLSIDEVNTVSVPPVRGIDLWPTPDGWKTGEEAWKPLEGHPGFFSARIKLLTKRYVGYLSQGHRFNYDVDQPGAVTDELVHQDSDGTRRRICLIRKGKEGEIYLPYLRKLEQYERIFAAVRLFADGRPVAVGKEISEKYPMIRLSPNMKSIDRVGKLVWDDDDGNAVWRSKESPHKLVGLDANRRVMWHSSVPKAGVISKGSFHEDGIEHLTKFLKGTGNHLGDSWMYGLKRINYNIANGIPVALSNPHLDEIQTSHGKWMRFSPGELRDAHPGEDRYWYFSGGGVSTSLLATQRHRDGWTYAVLSDFEQASVDPSIKDAMIRIMNEAKMTLSESALAALGIRRASDGHIGCEPLTYLEFGDMVLTKTDGRLPKWTVTVAHEAIGNIGLNEDNAWTMEFMPAIRDLPRVMADLGGAMEKISNIPTEEPEQESMLSMG